MEWLHEGALPEDGARYFPPASGVYDVKPGLTPLSTDWGNGPCDAQVFQFDSSWADYRDVKEQARGERLGKYYQTRGFDADLAGVICRFIAARLASEHPDRFTWVDDADSPRLHHAPSDETLVFNRAMTQVTGGGSPAYVDPLDALSAQVQEDLAVVRRVDGRDWCCAVHLCFPYRWTAEEKVGLDFVTMHLPVPGMENFRRPGMVNVMLQKGPLVRFVWELTTDRRLNHHPEPPPGVPAAAWARSAFDPAAPRLFLRVEREVLWSFPAQEAALLTIRTSFWDAQEIRQDPVRRDALCAAVESMTPASRVYKGLGDSGDAILAWLRAG